MIMNFDELIDQAMESDCDDLFIGDCFDEEEVINRANELTRRLVIGVGDGDYIEYDDGDLDVLIDNLI